jgi:hypothetical protein
MRASQASTGMMSVGAARVGLPTVLHPDNAPHFQYRTAAPSAPKPFLKA